LVFRGRLTEPGDSAITTVRCCCHILNLAAQVIIQGKDRNSYETTAETLRTRSISCRISANTGLLGCYLILSRLSAHPSRDNFCSVYSKNKRTRCASLSRSRTSSSQSRLAGIPTTLTLPALLSFMVLLIATLRSRLVRIATQKQLRVARGVRAFVSYQLVSHLVMIAITDNYHSRLDCFCAREALTLATGQQSTSI
jgi:hypothetical protein